MPGEAKAKPEEASRLELSLVAAGLDAARSQDAVVARAGELAVTTLGAKRAIRAVMGQWRTLPLASKGVARRLFGPWRDHLSKLRNELAGNDVEVVEWLLGGAADTSPTDHRASIEALLGSWDSITGDAVDALVAQAVRAAPERMDELLVEFRTLNERSKGAAVRAALFSLHPRDLQRSSPVLNSTRTLLQDSIGPSHERGVVALLDAGWGELSDLVMSYGSEAASAAVLRAAGRGLVSEDVASELVLRWPKGIEAAMVGCFDSVDPDVANDGAELFLNYASRSRSSSIREGLARLNRRANAETDKEWPAVLNRRRFAMLSSFAALQLGNKSMFPQVIVALRGPKSRFNAHLRIQAGNVLDRVTAKEWFSENAERAKSQYQEWYGQHGTALRWSKAEELFVIAED